MIPVITINGYLIRSEANILTVCFIWLYSGLIIIEKATLRTKKLGTSEPKTKNAFSIVEYLSILFTKTKPIWP